MLKTIRNAAEVMIGGITLRDLSKRYGSALAVDNVCLEVSPGEFLSLLGPSGSGKTTTLMMIAGFATPDTGRILLDGRDITRVPTHRREFGIIFQNYALFPHMTVAENVAYPLRMRRTARADIASRVNRVLEQVQLRSLADRYPHQMSGGQQQRVAIARALVFDPPVLLLDEPLGALDKKLRQHLRAEIKALHNEVGKTMIYVTHDQEEALAMSDRVAVMHEGRIRQVAPPRDMYSRPAELFVASFVGETNLIPVTLKNGLAHGPSGEHLKAPIWERGDTQATLCIRPENILFHITTIDTTADLVGTVASITYLGDATVVECVTTGGLRITSKLLNQSGKQLPSVGSSCTLKWASTDATILTQ